MVRDMIEEKFERVPICYPFNQKNGIKINNEHIPLEDYKQFIIENRIEQAQIIMPNLNILDYCKNLKYLNIAPSYTAPANFDFSPLYEIPEVLSLNCCNQYGDKNQYISEIDYSKINGIVELIVGINKGTKNYNRIETLKSLQVGAFCSSDISDLFCSKELDSLRLIECKVSSLKGIEKATKLQCLYLHYNRTLQDITALNKVKKTLKALRIENCPKIKDFSVLEELENLELLELTGSNELPSLKFIKSLKNLKTFVFNMNVKDGDLTPCMNLSYVYSEKNRKHYNLKDCELPKGNYIRGNENIDEWRRWE